jgi:hypothetical protein
MTTVISFQLYIETKYIWGTIITYGKLGSSVSIVPGYGLDDQAIEARSSVGARGFFL